jgi:hypothetical protein
VQYKLPVFTGRIIQLTVFPVLGTYVDTDVSVEHVALIFRITRLPTVHAEVIRDGEWGRLYR